MVPAQLQEPAVREYARGWTRRRVRSSVHARCEGGIRHVCHLLEVHWQGCRLCKDEQWMDSIDWKPTLIIVSDVWTTGELLDCHTVAIVGGRFRVGPQIVPSCRNKCKNGVVVLHRTYLTVANVRPEPRLEQLEQLAQILNRTRLCQQDIDLMMMHHLRSGKSS